MGQRLRRDAGPAYKAMLLASSKCWLNNGWETAFEYDMDGFQHDRWSEKAKKMLNSCHLFTLTKYICWITEINKNFIVNCIKSNSGLLS
jgi:hypothetical protein